jgi:hypothetical protein
MTVSFHGEGMPVETGNVLLLCAAAAGNSYSDGHEWSVAR